MNRHLSAAIKSALYRSGYYARRSKSIVFPGLAVFCYHGLLEVRRGLPFEPLHVSPSTFDEHCRVLRSCFNPVSLADVRAAWAGQTPLPPRAALVTFDDGYRSVLTLAKPILERHHIPAVVFVCSEPIEQRTLLWYDAVARTLGEPVVEQLKEVSYTEWLDVIQRFRVHASDDDPYTPLSINELRELAQTPGVDIGGHTLQHAILARAAPDEQRAQIVGNVRAIEEWVQKPVRAFSYPNGRPELDYTAASVDMVREAGYEIAFSTRTAFAEAGNSPMELPRFMLLASTTAPMLAHRFASGRFSASRPA